jgi:hypothetical protein
MTENNIYIFVTQVRIPIIKFICVGWHENLNWWCLCQSQEPRWANSNPSCRGVTACPPSSCIYYDWYNSET